MLCKDIMSYLDKLAPQSLACDWDNPGFQVGRADKEVKKILVALDATDEVIEQAVQEGADMIVTHHPMIFRAMKRVNDQDFIGRRIVKLLQNDISYFAMHTNFDIAPGCMADLAAEQLGIISEEPLEVTGEVDGQPVGIGKIGTLKMFHSDGMTPEEIASLVKEKFGLPYVTMYGAEQVKEPVSHIAISPGSGGSMVREAIKKRVPVLITGDIGHHDGIDAAANGVAVIDAGHYGIEQIFIPFVVQYLQKIEEGQLEVLAAADAFPSRVIL